MTRSSSNRRRRSIPIVAATCSTTCSASSRRICRRCTSRRPRMFGAHSARVTGVSPSVLRPNILWSADTLGGTGRVIRFLVRRLAFALFLVVAVSSAALFLTRLAPGDVTAQLGPFASPAEIARTRARFDLDRTPAAQWALWTGRAVRFDFGESFLYSRPVASLLGPAAANTAALGIVALAVATLLGIPLGVITGSRRGFVPACCQGSVPRVPLHSAAARVAGCWCSLPPARGWLPLGGMTSAGALDLGWSAWLIDVAWHLPLPTLALALADCGHVRASSSTVDERGGGAALRCRPPPPAACQNAAAHRARVARVASADLRGVRAGDRLAAVRLVRRGVRHGMAGARASDV